jgi:hypothetical protein
MPFSGVEIELNSRLPYGTLAEATRNKIRFAPGAFAPTTREGTIRILHEFAHVAQLRGGSGCLPDLQSRAEAEFEARDAAVRALLGERSRLSPFADAPLFDSPIGSSIRTNDPLLLLNSIKKALETLPDGSDRNDMIDVVVGLAMMPNAANADATKLLISMVMGTPKRRFFDHYRAINDLATWTSRGIRAYDFILYGRYYYADHSQNDLISVIVVPIFQRYLHYQGGALAVRYLERKLTGDDDLAAKLAARIVADLLELESTPEAQKYKANYVKLRQMAIANGWESYGALAATSATPRIFSALEAIRKQADTLERIIRLGPIYDDWEDTDVDLLSNTVSVLSLKGLRVSPTGKLEFTAENREETEHQLLTPKYDAKSSGEWLQEMARTFTIAADAGIHVQKRVESLHSGASALDQVLGAQAASQTIERQAIFDLRHEYIQAWLSVGNLSFGPGSSGLADEYKQKLDAIDQKFDHFDQEVADRKYDRALERFNKYSKWFLEGQAYYTGDNRLDYKFFLMALQDLLKSESRDLQNRFSRPSAVQMPNTGVIVIFGSPGPQPRRKIDLDAASRLDRDAAIFGMHAALFLLYATNLTIHQQMVATEVGSKSFREEQGKKLSTMRQEMRDQMLSGNFDQFFQKQEGYRQTLDTVISDMKHEARIDLLKNLAITVVTALITEGASLAIRAASLSETIAIARTARALSSVSTLVEVGIFTSTELSLQHVVFGKEITGAEVLKSAVNNLAFAGALKAVAAFAEPLAKGGTVRKLLFGNLIAFSGTAAISATLTRITSGSWPPDIALFLTQTAASYLLIVGVHHAFDSMVAKPELQKLVKSRLENLDKANEALRAKLDDRINSGTLTRAEFESIKQERQRLVEEARAVAQAFRDANGITAEEMAGINKMADNAIADARNASFPDAGSAASPDQVRGLPPPESAPELVRVGDSDTYVYNPAKPHTNLDAMLVRYKEKGFTVEGNSSLIRVVDPQGRTRFLLASGPVVKPTLFLPPGSSEKAPAAGALERATGLKGDALENARATLVRINRDAETKIIAEYSDYAALQTFSLLIEQVTVIGGGWSIDAVRGVADALTLEKGIPRSAVRRLMQTVEPAKLQTLFEAYHAISSSPKVRPGSNYLIADDLLPKNSVKLIEAWRQMMAKGIELPEDMDMRATRGVLRLMEDKPGSWLNEIAKMPKARRAAQLRAKSALSDPTVKLPENVTELLAVIAADIPGHPGLSPLSGSNGDAFVKEIESQQPNAKFDSPDLRQDFVNKVDLLRRDVALLEQGGELKHGLWEGVVGRAKEVIVTSRVLLDGGTVLSSDREIGAKNQLPNVNLENFALPGGGKVKNAPQGKDVHIDLLYRDAAGAMVALEATTAELALPDALSALDPKSANYGSDIDWSMLDSSNASHRKFMQAIKIYQLNKMATALSTHWSGRPADPAVMRMAADNFSVPAARALENLGFQLELADGTRVTAKDVEASKKASGKKPK